MNPKNVKKNSKDGNNSVMLSQTETKGNVKHLKIKKKTVNSLNSKIGKRSVDNNSQKQRKAILHKKNINNKIKGKMNGQRNIANKNRHNNNENNIKTEIIDPKLHKERQQLMKKAHQDKKKQMELFKLCQKYITNIQSLVIIYYIHFGH